MEDLNNITFDALERYYTVLENLGYTTESDTNKLLLLQFLQGFLQEFIYYITEEDYNTIEKIVQCLTQTSCLIPYREYQLLSIPLTNYINNVPIKITQDNVINVNELTNNLNLVDQ